MKTIILFLILTVSAFARFVPEGMLSEPLVPSFPTIAECQNQAQGDCYDAEAFPNLGILKVEEYPILDYSKPIYSARTNESDCQLSTNGAPYPEEDCRVLAAYELVGEVSQPKLCTDKSYSPFYALKADFDLGEGYFAYCAKITGYEETGQIGKRLVVDPVKVAAVQAAAAKDACYSEYTARRSKELADSDWTQAGDIGDVLTVGNIAAWKAYRTAIRMLRTTVTRETCLDGITWPAKPSVDYLPAYIP